ncbi:hypothetical protein EDB81DRAFT_245477 [Dactylonectria macrodidyma]|uniref:Uncharacterized protein n=1 Tax=Dactylonectria macrodidyma TaxID=307937 RepID=A0A9P9DBR4_9HYPO|nr:hypothetical protein EDB81DRAFT_245477 [Dactylonectria macrodidyma]
MIFPVALIGLFLAAANAAPIKETTVELNSTTWTPDHILKHDEVILYGDGGRMEVVHESVFQSLFEEEGVSFDAPEINHDYLNITASDDKLKERDFELDERGLKCAWTNPIIIDTVQTFIDWDVQMSPVVIGTGTGIDVYVSQGYSVANSVSVSGGAEFGPIKKALSLSVGVDYTESWTTQTVINIKGNVPNGYSGVMITRPIKTRRYGRSFTGCIGSLKQNGNFMADSYKQGSYAGVKWVSGAITMCTKKQFPLTRCNGAGTFI